MTGAMMALSAVVPRLEAVAMSMKFWSLVASALRAVHALHKHNCWEVRGQQRVALVTVRPEMCAGKARMGGFGGVRIEGGACTAHAHLQRSTGTQGMGGIGAVKTRAAQALHTHTCSALR